MRIAGSLALAAFVAWLGGEILGEYPFRGPLPVLGGFLLGMTVVGAIAVVLRREPPAWLVVLGAACAAGGEALAVNHDTAGLRPWPVVGYVSVGAAALAGLWRWWGGRPASRRA
jgi:hypothetical protein